MSAARSGRRSGDVTPQSSSSDTRYEDVRRSLAVNIEQAAVADGAVDEESGMISASQLKEDIDKKHERFSRVSTQHAPHSQPQAQPSAVYSC